MCECDNSERSASETNLNEIYACEQISDQYSQRFSLCVLDVVRKLQKYSVFEKGVEKCHIMEYLKQQPFVDGDLSSQVSTALKELESKSYVIYVGFGYKTFGPYAKSKKTTKRKRLACRKR